MSHHRRVLGAAALGLAVVLSACSVSTSDSATSSTTTAARDEGQPAGPPPQGVTDDTITLGAAIIDVDQVREQFGVELGTLPEEVIPALVEAVNADGGINGRTVEVVERRFLPVGNEPSEQVCRELVEDDQVMAVMGSFLSDNALCVTETYGRPYFGGWGLTPERQERSEAPYVTTAANEADSIRESMELLADEGLLDDAKVAVYHEADMSPEFAADYVVAPLEAAGVEVVSVVQRADAAGDQVAAGADLDRILQRFEADGADTLIVAAGLPVMVPALERTEWAPQLIFTNGQIIGAEALEGYGLTDPSELAGAIGAVPGTISDEVAEDPRFLDCIDAINAHSDLDISVDDIYSPDERPGSREMGQLPGLCALWDLTRTVLTAAGDDLSNEGILAGLATLDSFEMQGNPEASLSEERWGAGTPARLWEYHEDRVEFLPADI